MKLVRVLFAVFVILLHAPPLFAASTNDAPIELVVSGDESFERVRAALNPKVRTAGAGEKGADGKRRLIVEVRETTVTVTYRNESGREVARSLQTANKESTLEAAALLAENLVTDQTSTLLVPKPERPFHPAVVSFVYPLATNWGKPDVRTPFALDALYGRVGEIDGLQLSGLVGQVGGSVNGAQISGIGSYSGEDVAGLQMAGITSIAKGPVYGAQISGITNIAPGGIDGLQLSPVNVAGDVSGAQIGVLNVGRKVKGFQLGVVNIADDLDGGALGVFSYSRTGRMGAIAWSSNHGLANFGLKFASKYMYSVVRGTYSHERGTDFIGPGVNVGVHLPVLDPFFVDLDLGTSWLFRTKGGTGATNFDDHQARVLVGAELFNHFSVFGGGGLDVQVERDGINRDDVRFGPVFSAGVQVLN